MKSVLHGIATLVLVAVSAFCLLVQVAHVDDALSSVSSDRDVPGQR